MQYPRYFAEFYDFIYSKLRSETDFVFFSELVEKSKGPVLEIGVGTGRLFTESLTKGADIYGIDISPEMLKILKKKIPVKDHRRIKCQDVTKLSLDKKFDLAIAPFRVFSHIIDIKDQLKALNRIYDHLKPGGMFVFDLFVPNLEILQKGFRNFLDFDEEYKPGKRLQRYVSTKSDLVNQLTEVCFKLVWDDDQEKKEEIFSFIFRYYFRFEIEHLIARSKFTLESFYGDYELNPINSASKEMVIVCRKKK